MTIELRQVTAKNVDTAIQVAVEISGKHYKKQIRQEFRASVGKKKEKKAVKRDLHICKATYFILYKGGEAAGMVGHYRNCHNKNDAWLGWLGIYPKFINQGLGKLLIEEAFRLAAQQTGPVDVQRIWTTPESEYDKARAVYRKLGFIEETYKPEAKDAANLIKVFSRAAGRSRFMGKIALSDRLRQIHGAGP